MSSIRIAALGRAKSIPKICLVLLPCTIMVLLAVPSNPTQRQASAATGELINCSTSASNVSANGYSDNPSISSDGRYVAFDSAASNLISNDNNSNTDIFRKDLVTNGVVCCSKSQSGNLGNGYSSKTAISANGCYVAFESSANNLVAGDTNSNKDVFRKDLQTGEVIRCSTTSLGEQITTGGEFCDMSSDGRYILQKAPFPYIKDMNTGELTRCFDENISNIMCISPDGIRVVFCSNLEDLVDNDHNGVTDVFVKDITNGTIELCSITADGTQADGGSGYTADISADNRFVLFMSTATNLVHGVTGLHYYRKDLQSGDIVLCDCDALGIPGKPSPGSNGRISADGRFVAFEAFNADELSPRVHDGPNVLRKDLVDGTVLCCNDNYWPDDGYNGLSGSSPAISADGRYVAFEGSSSNYIYRKEPELERPTITGINPSHARINEEVTIEGFNFGSSRGKATVSFDSAQATEYANWSDRAITVRIPCAGYEDSKINVKVTNYAGSYEYYDFQLDSYSLCFAEGYTAVASRRIYASLILMIFRPL